MSTNNATMTSMTSMDDLWMVSLTLVCNLHNSSPISSISMIDHMLDASIWKCNCVLSLYVAGSISGPLFTEVCVVIVIMDTIVEVKWIWLIAVLITSMSTMSSMTNQTN